MVRCMSEYFSSRLSGIVVRCVECVCVRVRVLVTYDPTGHPAAGVSEAQASSRQRRQTSPARHPSYEPPMMHLFGKDWSHDGRSATALLRGRRNGETEGKEREGNI